MTERHFLAGLVFRLLRPEDARSAEVNDHRLALAVRDDTIRVPLRYIHGARLAHQLGRSSLIVDHDTGRTTVSGLAPGEARKLVQTIELARRKWWQTTLANERNTLAALMQSLNYLERPRSYITQDAFSRVLTAARASLDNLAGHSPPPIASSPELAAADRLRAFLQDPHPERTAANERYIRDELAASSTFFDEIEAQPLTAEQRTAIVTDEQHNLVVAAAGSGKTSVIVAKAAWLVQAGHHPPSDLLLLAFARDARNEMEHRMTSRMGSAAPQDLTVSTFHSLGLAIMGEVEGRRPSLSSVADDPKALTGLLSHIVSNLLAHPAHSQDLLAWLQNRFAPYKTEHDFSNLGDYYAHIRQYDLRSLQGDKVRSFEECEIANFLFLNGIAYEYEAPYEHDTATPQRRQYKPDFHIIEPSIYIEHFGIDMRGRTPPFVDRHEYLSERAWKLDLHAHHGTTLIETFSHQHQTGTLRRSLVNALVKHGVQAKPIPPERVFDILHEQGRIAPFIRLVSTFLANFKSAGLKFQDLAERARDTRGRERAEAFIRIFKPIHDAYQETLHRENQIDFHDMIHCAARYVEDSKYLSPYHYILIDEFQDISPARARLVKALVRQAPTNRLFAVGDDWQAISRYTGADISIMREFGKHFGNHEQLRLETTFRCPDRLADVATQFILRNPAQIPKTVRSIRSAEDPCIHLGLSAKPGTPLIDEAIERIRDHAETFEGDPTILVLARYNHMLKHHHPLRRRYPKLHFAFKTVHASKGLEADYVILLSLTAGKYAFPTEIVDDPLLDLVLATPEPHTNAEERRLFYVALTRARRHIYLLADDGPPSSFANELLHGGYDIALFGQPPAPDVACPLCLKGKMQPRNRPGNRDLFYGCSNYPYCHHTTAPCPSCNTGLPVKTDDGMACPNCGHATTPCPRCSGWLRNRKRDDRSFLGCNNYPACRYSRNVDDDAATPPPTAPTEPGAVSQLPPEPSPAEMRPEDTDPQRPLRIGDAVRFATRGQTVHGHLLEGQRSRRFSKIIDADDRIWKVPKTDLTAATGHPRRAVIITPNNETRAALRLGDAVTFQTPEGPVDGEIVKLNPIRAKVQCGDAVWNVPYPRLSPSDSEATGANRERLHAVAAMARQLIDRHGLTDWTLAFSETRRRLGHCDYRDKVIRIALQHALGDADESIRDTVLHEIAHAIAGCEAGHGPLWKEIAQKIGATPAAKKYETLTPATSQSPERSL